MDFLSICCKKFVNKRTIFGLKHKYSPYLLFIITIIPILLQQSQLLALLIQRKDVFCNSHLFSVQE